MSTAVDTAAYAAESNLPKILGVLTTFFLLAAITVGCRIYTRLFITRAAGVDDAFIGLALLCQVGAWIVLIIQSYHGLGHHQSTISAADDVIFNHASFWGNVIGIAIGTMFLKLSIATNLLRLCQNRWYSVVLWILIVIIFLYELVGILFFFLNCKPISGNWDTSVDATCASTDTIVIFGLVNTSFNIFTDVSLAIIPIPIIWNLNMKKSVRLYLIGVLSLGYLAVVMDIVKTYYQETYTITTDETFTWDLIFYGFLEDNIGMIAASAPMLKPLVGKVLGLETRSDGAYYQYGSRNTNVNHRGNANAMRSNVHDRAFGRAEAGYELEDRETDSDGASGVSAQKGEESMSGGNALYRHEMGSQDKILHYSAYRTTVENGLSRPSPHNKSSFQGITRTTEVTVE